MTHEGAVMDIVVWPRSLDLGTYEAVFHENEIKNYDEKHRSWRLTSSPGAHERLSIGARHASWPKCCCWTVSTPPTAAPVARTGSQEESAGCSAACAPTVESHAR
jgi:hypothetical protein